MSRQGRPGLFKLSIDQKKKQATELNNGTLPRPDLFYTGDNPEKKYTTDSINEHGDQKNWSWDCLPEILYYLLKPELPKADIKPLKEKGKPVPGYKGRECIRDIEVLPRYIALDVPTWMIEAWRVLDERVTYTDILDRMGEDKAWGFERPNKNALQQRCTRETRRLLHNFVACKNRTFPTQEEVRAVERLSPFNVQYNTTLHRSKEGYMFLTRQKMRKLEGQIVTESIDAQEEHDLGLKALDFDHFLLDDLDTMATNKVAMWYRESIDEAVKLLFVLQERARAHGLRAGEKSAWERLPNRCKPAEWNEGKRVQASTRKRLTDDTYYPDCDACQMRDADEVTIYLQGNEIIIPPGAGRHSSYVTRAGEKRSSNEMNDSDDNENSDDDVFDDDTTPRYSTAHTQAGSGMNADGSDLMQMDVGEQDCLPDGEYWSTMFGEDAAAQEQEEEEDSNNASTVAKRKRLPVVGQKQRKASRKQKILPLQDQALAMSQNVDPNEGDGWDSWDSWAGALAADLNKSGSQDVDPNMGGSQDIDPNMGSQDVHPNMNDDWDSWAANPSIGGSQDIDPNMGSQDVHPNMNDGWDSWAADPNMGGSQDVDPNSIVDSANATNASLNKTQTTNAPFIFPDSIWNSFNPTDITNDPLDHTSIIDDFNMSIDIENDDVTNFLNARILATGHNEQATSFNNAQQAPGFDNVHWDQQATGFNSGHQATGFDNVQWDLQATGFSNAQQDDGFDIAQWDQQTTGFNNAQQDDGFDVTQWNQQTTGFNNAQQDDGDASSHWNPHGGFTIDNSAMIEPLYPAGTALVTRGTESEHYHGYDPDETEDEFNRSVEDDEAIDDIPITPMYAAGEASVPAKHRPIYESLEPMEDSEPMDHAEPMEYPEPHESEVSGPMYGHKEATGWRLPLMREDEIQPLYPERTALRSAKCTAKLINYDVWDEDADGEEVEQDANKPDENAVDLPATTPAPIDVNDCPIQPMYPAGAVLKDGGPPAKKPKLRGGKENRPPRGRGRGRGNGRGRGRGRGRGSG